MADSWSPSLPAHWAFTDQREMISQPIDSSRVETNITADGVDRSRPRSLEGNRPTASGRLGGR